MELNDNTPVYVLTSREGRFIGLTELTSDHQWVFAFTSQEEAKKFLRITRSAGLFENANRLFPCTLAEWFDMQAKNKFPDLAINPDPEQVRDYPLMVGDITKHNIVCLTRALPNGGKVYQIDISSRKNVAK